MRRLALLGFLLLALNVHAAPTVNASGSYTLEIEESLPLGDLYARLGVRPTSFGLVCSDFEINVSLTARGARLSWAPYRALNRSVNLRGADAELIREIFQRSGTPGTSGILRSRVCGGLQEQWTLDF